MRRDGRGFDHWTLEAIRLMAVERVRDGESPSSVMGSRHRTGRIARFVARMRNNGAQPAVPIELGHSRHLQPIEFLEGHRVLNRPKFIWDNELSSE
jgi:hypothetical protein